MYSGYLAGCTVFLDSNQNGVLDADELAMARDGGMLPDGAAAPDAG